QSRELCIHDFELSMDKSSFQWIYDFINNTNSIVNHLYLMDGIQKKLLLPNVGM
ncbi:unnamed protein product, partial [Heterotrigona itama]